MKEKSTFPRRFGGTNNCVLEEFAGRPKDCPNNPWRYPGNHRPAICQQCPGNPIIWKVAEKRLPPMYVQLKQGGTLQIAPEANSEQRVFSLEQLI